MRIADLKAGMLVFFEGSPNPSIVLKDTENGDILIGKSSWMPIPSKLENIEQWKETILEIRQPGTNRQYSWGMFNAPEENEDRNLYGKLIWSSSKNIDWYKNPIVISIYTKVIVAVKENHAFEGKFDGIVVYDPIGKKEVGDDICGWDKSNFIIAKKEDFINIRE